MQAHQINQKKGISFLKLTTEQVCVPRSEQITTRSTEMRTWFLAVNSTPHSKTQVLFTTAAPEQSNLKANLLVTSS
jgi:hypothetical protein